jgi:Predicted Zn peptidase
MNSRIKGDALESKFLRLLKRNLVQGNFFVSSERCKVFSKKGYYSKDREKEIVFDISIEVYLPGKTTYSLLILIECKNYNHPVPVDDVEEFYQKLQQVSGAKGIMVSTSSFQESALTFSKSKGIGIIRYYDNKQIKWELTRSPSMLVSLSFAEIQSLTARRGLSTETYESRYFDCYCYSDGKYTNSLRAFFSGLLLQDLSEDLRQEVNSITRRIDDIRSIVKYIEESRIENISETILIGIGYGGGRVSVLDICNQLIETNSLKLVFESAENSDGLTLGTLKFNPLEIQIYSSPNQEDREKFTLAHELGHYFLNHFKYMASESLEERDLDVEEPLELGIKDLMRMEWQANYFASCLLLPTKSFAADFFSIAQSHGLKDRGYGALYVDDQPCNIQSFYAVTGELKMRYGVSRQVVKLRLKKLGLLTEASVAESIDLQSRQA